MNACMIAVDTAALDLVNKHPLLCCVALNAWFDAEIVSCSGRLKTLVTCMHATMSGFKAMCLEQFDSMMIRSINATVYKEVI